MRLLRWVIGLTLVAAVAAFVWGLVMPRRKIPATPIPVYVAPEPAADEEVSVPDAVPLDADGASAIPE